jgi:solute carrier family 10 (sodium/bile acid cotransporter), member 7
MLRKLYEHVPDSFTAAIIGIVVLGLLLPCHGESARLVSVSSEVAITFLFFLQGARLSRSAVLAGILHWRLHLIIFIATFVIFPLFIARSFGLSRQDEIAIVFCGSKKSLVTGIPMASALFTDASLGLVVLPLMIFHRMQLMACATLARRYASSLNHRIVAPDRPI